SEKEKIIKMEEMLGKRIIGQDLAVKSVSDAIRRSRAGLSDPRRPMGSFLFLGPTGVGKTELARSLADFLFDDENAMIRMDMSEYMEKHSVSRFIGAPPGYVGYDEGGQLTEAVRRRPYSVILLDEIEKAHNDVFNVLLQVLDEGHMTDGKGRRVNFKNTIVIMTSNAGSRIIQSLAGDYKKIEERIESELKLHFKPEFLNRIDEIITFNNLSKGMIEEITEIQLNHVKHKLAQNQVELSFLPEAVSLIAARGYDPVYGARPLKRIIQKEVENRLAQRILENNVDPGDRIMVGIKGGELNFTIKR
ncbi:MAG: AAA family ATPase, partial [bacterium]